MAKSLHGSGHCSALEQTGKLSRVYRASFQMHAGKQDRFQLPKT